MHASADTDLVRKPAPTVRQAVALAAAGRATDEESLLEALLVTTARDRLWHAIVGSQA